MTPGKRNVGGAICGSQLRSSDQVTTHVLHPSVLPLDRHTTTTTPSKSGQPNRAPSNPANQLLLYQQKYFEYSYREKNIAALRHRKGRTISHRHAGMLYCCVCHFPDITSAHSIRTLARSVAILRGCSGPNTFTQKLDKSIPGRTNPLFVC